MYNRLAIQIILTIHVLNILIYFISWAFLIFCGRWITSWKIISYFIYDLDFKYGDQSSITGGFATNYVINIMQWHVEIEIFNPAHKTRFINEKSLCVVGLSSAFRFGTCFVFVGLMLFACGGNELNAGHKKELLPQFLSMPLEFKQRTILQ